MAYKITSDGLVTAGYRKSMTRRGVSISDEYRPLYQKAIRDSDTRLYFINFWEYDHTFLEAELGVRYDTESQFRINDLSVNVQPIPYEESIEEIEAFFAMAYKNLGCTPYDRD